jgi:GT2 family glycosyltransferase
VAAVSVVVITKDRRDSLLRTLERLLALPERPEIVVVDNGSRDATADTVASLAREQPSLRLVRLPVNRGAPARNVGVAAASGEIIAFCDDDSWWEPGALARASRILAEFPATGVLVGRVQMWPHGDVDAVTRKMRRAPLGHAPGAAGPSVLGFPAFAAIVRRAVFEQVGGFSELLFFGGEERLFALDAAAAGWQLSYVDELVTWHTAESGALTPRRWALHARNDALVDWLRRPVPHALRSSAALLAQAPRNRAAAGAAAGVLRRLPAALRARRPVSRVLHEMLLREDRPLSGPLG